MDRRRLRARQQYLAEHQNHREVWHLRSPQEEEELGVTAILEEEVGLLGQELRLS